MDLTDTDRELLADAVAFYLDRVKFSTGDPAQAAYTRLASLLADSDA